MRGSIEQAFDEPGNKNSFFYFFRAEGRTGKSDGDRGRWGVGKHVFPRSSRINTVFGLTVRSDDKRRMLMGHAVLKSHKIGNDHWSPDGYFGHRPNDLVLPSEGQAELGRFLTDFRIAREKESGLSLVVPYVEEEITYDELVRAVVDGYFFPILCGQVTVDIEAPNAKCSITAQSLVDVALGIGGPHETERLARVELAEWAAKCDEADLIDLVPCANHKPTWSNEIVPAEKVSALRNKLVGGQKIAIRAHVLVRPKGSTDQQSHFDMFLWERGNDDGRPIFIREGLTITDVRGARAREVMSIVLVNDKPLATLLGDSENPAHTQWQRDSSNFKNKYIHGSLHIDFVKRAVARTIGVLRDSGAEHDVSTLADVFPRPIDETDARLRPETYPSPKPKPEEAEEDDTPPIPSKPAGYRLQRVTGGFSVQRGHKDAELPNGLLIRVAYDIRQGNPLRKYDVADFRLDRTPIKLSKQVGVQIRECSENQLLFDVVEPDFNITVGGFDENRDLYINVKAIGPEDAAAI